FGLLESDAEDHLAAALPGRHCRQQLTAAVEHADFGRPVSLMSGEGIEVATERLHVDRQPWCRLTAVDQHLGALPVCKTNDGLDWHERARRIGDMGHRHKTRTRRQAP